MRTEMSGFGCLVAFLTVLIVNVTAGAMSVNYLLLVWFAKDIPWLGDLAIGLIGGEVTIPLAVITWILRMFGAV